MDKQITNIVENVLEATISGKLQWTPNKIDNSYYCDISDVRLNISRTSYFRGDEFLFEIWYDSNCIVDWGEYCEYADKRLGGLYKAVTAGKGRGHSGWVRYDIFGILDALETELEHKIRNEELETDLEHKIKMRNYNES